MNESSEDRGKQARGIPARGLPGRALRGGALPGADGAAPTSLSLPATALCERAPVEARDVESVHSKTLRSAEDGWRAPDAANPHTRSRRNDDGVAIALEVVRQIPGIRTVLVTDDSMLDAGVCKGDTVLLQPSADIGQGELAAVQLAPSGPTVLRRIHREGNELVLRAEGSTRVVERVPREDVLIRGRVVALVRERAA